MIANTSLGAGQAQQLRQMLIVLAVLGALIGSLELALGLVFTGTPLLAVGIISIGFSLLAALALAYVRRGQSSAAALVIAVAIVVVALAVALLLPALTMGMSMMPLLALALLLPYIASRTLLMAGVLSVLAALAIFAFGALAPLSPSPLPPTVALLLGAIAIGTVSGVTATLLWQFSARLNATLAQSHEANAALEDARAWLERRVDARTEELRGALADVQARAEEQARLLGENAEQRIQIREMSVPVLPVSRNTIAIPLVGALDDARLEMLQEQTLGAISASSSRYVLLDITGVPVVDTHVAQGIVGVVTAARLLGAEVVLVGVRPEVAQAVVSLGLDLRGITTRQSLYEGIAYSQGSRG